MLTDATTRTIDSMTPAQLVRLYNRIYDRIGRGWDHPTLRVVHPHIYAVLMAMSLRYRKITATA